MSAAHSIQTQEHAEQAVKLQRLAGACRQIGAMMEAGIDILSITRVLRSQTEDEDIARLCEHIDFDLKRGRSLVEALAGEPTLFSPFAVSLVRQGEERNTLPQAFARLADFLDRERADLLDSSPSTSAPSQSSTNHISTPQVPPQVLAGVPQVLGAHAFDLERAEARWLRVGGSVGAGLLAASAVGEALAASGVAGARWARPVARLLSAIVLAAAARSAREPMALSGHTGPSQVLEKGRAEPEGESEPLQTVNLEASRPDFENTKPQDARPVEARGVYAGAPREDEEDEAPRWVPRPRDEEEFD